VFAIELLEQDGPPEDSIRGRITVGAFTEEFEASLTFWTADDYRASWRAALSVLAGGETTVSCLVSSITDPATSNFVFCWPLYRDGDDVYVQSSLIFLDEISGKFDPARPWLFVQPRSTVDEDGNRISEWHTDIASIRQFRTVLDRRSG
jgi:hypothetical protein